MSLLNYVNRASVAPKDINKLGEHVTQSGIGKKVVEAGAQFQGQPFSSWQLAAVLGLPCGRVSSALCKLANRGKVDRVPAGLWRFRPQ